MWKKSSVSSLLCSNNNGLYFFYCQWWGIWPVICCCWKKNVTHFSKALRTVLAQFWWKQFGSCYKTGSVLLKVAQRFAGCNLSFFLFATAQFYTKLFAKKFWTPSARYTHISQPIARQPHTLSTLSSLRNLSEWRTILCLVQTTSPKLLSRTSDSFHACVTPPPRPWWVGFWDGSMCLGWTVNFLQVFLNNFGVAFGRAGGWFDPPPSGRGWVSKK